MKKIIVVAAVFVALCLCMAPVSSRDVIDNVPTIYIGEEHLNLKFLEGSESKLFGWYDWRHEGMVIGQRPQIEIDLSDSYTDASFSYDKFNQLDGPWWSLEPDHTWGALNTSKPHFALLMPPTPTQTSTPVPTPSEGNLIVSSSPSDATVYVDNVIKGITPLTINIENGAHVVRIQKIGFYESKSDINIMGEDEHVDVELVSIPVTTTPTTIITTIPTTTIPTTIPTTIVTTVVPTTEPTVMPTDTITVTETEEMVSSLSMEEPVDNSEQIESMQAQIYEQGEKIEEQNERIGVLEQMIDFILRVFGLK